MRRVIPPSDCRDRGQYQEEKLARASRIMVALFVLLMPAMPLRAQSELKSFPGLHEFSSTPDSIYSYDPGALDLGFNPDSGPILAAGNGVSLMGNASTAPWHLHS